MQTERHCSRRRFLHNAAISAGGLAMAGCANVHVGGASGMPASNQKDEVSPGEDLMREHGVLRRIILIYRQCDDRLDNADQPQQAIASAAQIVRQFIEEYHEKLEEDYLFPRFEKAGILAELTRTLRLQHEAGRALTARILRSSAQQTLKTQERSSLRQNIRDFIRMYEPHAAREDTVLFPAIRRVYLPKEYEHLGEVFEDKEHDLFGEGGFETIVEKVAAIEKSLGIHDLNQFTPKV